MARLAGPRRMIGRIVSKTLREAGGPFPATVELTGGYKGPAKVHGIHSVSDGERQYVEILLEVPPRCLGAICLGGDTVVRQGRVSGVACWVHEKDIHVFGSLHWRTGDGDDEDPPHGEVDSPL